MVALLFFFPTRTRQLHRQADVIDQRQMPHESAVGVTRGDSPVLFLFPFDKVSDVGPGIRKKLDDINHMVNAFFGDTSSWGGGSAHSHTKLLINHVRSADDI